MLSNFNNKFDTSYFDRAAKLGYTVDEIVNLAAIIEKEAKLPAEQLIISSVFHNRLSTGNPDKLESCATVQYAYQTAYGERKSRILDADTRIDHPYNTYIHRGLPPDRYATPDSTQLSPLSIPRILTISTSSQRRTARHCLPRPTRNTSQIRSLPKAALPTVIETAQKRKVK